MRTALAIITPQWGFASKTGDGLYGELHQPPDRRRRNLDTPSVITRN